MKNLFKSLLLTCVAVLGMSSCEDVPSPYNLPEGGGTKTDSAIVVTAAEAVQIIASELADGETSSKTYCITGYITDVFSTISNNQQSFWMADTKDGGKILEAYWANLPEGVSSFTKGTKVKITGKLTRYVKSGSTDITPEMKNATVEILESGGGYTPTPEGTVVTCDEAQAIGLALEDKDSTTKTYSVTGYITDVFSTISNNQQSFWMADTKDGGKVLEAYWANLPTGVSAFSVGMKVKITGNIMRYGSNAEIKNATVEILESGGGDTPTGSDLTCAQASALALALEDKTPSTETYNVTGYITSIVGSVSKNQQTFWMADIKDGGKVFEAYWANLPEGVTEFAVGMKVKITGLLMRYGTTPEMKNATVVILESGGGDEPDPQPSDKSVSVDGTTVTLTNTASTVGTESTTIDFGAQGWDNATVVTKVSMSDGTVIEFGAGSNTNPPKFYTATGGVRVYANNTISFSASKSIAQIVMNCDTYNGIDYVGNKDEETVTFSGNTAFYTNTYTGTGGGVQLRVKALTVYYAK